MRLPTFSLRLVTSSVAAQESQAVSDTSSREEAEITFRVKAVDRDGNPVANVFVQLCDDSTCTPVMTDAQGIAAFTMEISVFVLPVPFTPTIILSISSQLSRRRVQGQYGFSVASRPEFFGLPSSYNYNTLFL